MLHKYVLKYAPDGDGVHAFCRPLWFCGSTVDPDRHRCTYTHSHTHSHIFVLRSIYNVYSVQVVHLQTSCYSTPNKRFGMFTEVGQLVFNVRALHYAVVEYSNMRFS